MNEAEFDEEFNVEDITNAIVNQAKAEVKSKFGNKKRHRQWSVKPAVWIKKTLTTGIHIKPWVITRCGVPREPKITNMDWRALGYWPVYKDGKKVWEKDDDQKGLQ